MGRREQGGVALRRRCPPPPAAVSRAAAAAAGGGGGGSAGLRSGRGEAARDRGARREAGTEPGSGHGALRRGGRQLAGREGGGRPAEGRRRCPPEGGGGRRGRAGRARGRPGWLFLRGAGCYRRALPEAAAAVSARACGGKRPPRPGAAPPLPAFLGSGAPGVAAGPASGRGSQVAGGTRPRRGRGAGLSRRTHT